MIRPFPRHSVYNCLQFLFPTTDFYTIFCFLTIDSVNSSHFAYQLRHLGPYFVFLESPLHISWKPFSPNSLGSQPACKAMTSSFGYFVNSVRISRLNDTCLDFLHSPFSLFFSVPFCRMFRFQELGFRPATVRANHLECLKP